VDRLSGLDASFLYSRGCAPDARVRAQFALTEDMSAALAELVAVARVAGTPDLVNTRTRSTTG
jgi:hypothetical protein